MNSNSNSGKLSVSLSFVLLLWVFLPSISMADGTPEKQMALCLQISHFHSQKPLGRWALESPHFALSFVHSVSQTPVVDFYRLQKKNNTLQITQVAERFEHHGAGLPSHVDEGSHWIHQNGYFWLTMQRPIAQLIVRTDKDYNNRLHLDKQVYQLNADEDERSVGIDLNQWPDAALWIQPITCLKHTKR